LTDAFQNGDVKIKNGMPPTRQMPHTRHTGIEMVLCVQPFHLASRSLDLTEELGFEFADAYTPDS